MEKSVFISHSQKDKAIADFMCSSLETGNIGCWIAPRDIPYGNDWAGEITKAIEQCSVFVFILSQYSNMSRQCPKEITVADNIGVPIICIKIDDVEMNPSLRYHLSSQQMVIVDASKINEEMESIAKAVISKLNSFNLLDDNCIKGGQSNNRINYNVDKELDEKFDQVFSDKSEKETKDSIELSMVDFCSSKISKAHDESEDYIDDEDHTYSFKEKLENIAAQKFMDHFADSLECCAEKVTKSIAQTSQNSLKKLVLAPIDATGRYLEGKHFSIPNIEGVKTLAFQLRENVIDFTTKTKYSDCVLLESTIDYTENFTTFYVNDLTIDGTSLILMHFCPNGDKLYCNIGLLWNDKVSIIKKASIMTFQKLCVSNSKISLNNVGYNTEALSISNFAEMQGNNEEIWYEADIRNTPTVIIDPETVELVRREVFYDASSNSIKAKMKLMNNKTYLAFQIRNGDTVSTATPISKLEQGVYYRNGLFGFPKDLMAAAELLEKDGSNDALLEMALLFREPGEYYDEAMYRQLLQQAVDTKSEKALIEQALGIAFNELSSPTLDDCISDLTEIAMERSRVGDFVLAYLTEHIDSRRAFELYLKSAKKDYLPAISRLQCGSSVSDIQDYDALYNMFLESINNNSGVSEYCMGCAVFYGYEIQPRKKAGLDLLVKSANLGDSDSHKILFDIFDSDDEYKDKVQALLWLEKIALRDKSVRVKLANRYIDGIGCESSFENDQCAFKWLVTLQESDDRTAINNLGWMYKLGRGCEQDYVKAKGLFERAASMGSYSSYYHLGTLYEDGLGVPKDIGRAKDMYQYAAENGSEKAKERLKELVDEIT